MEITVNGERREIAANATLTDLVTQLGLDPTAVAALVNDEVVERDKFDSAVLNAGDSVELVRFVPGG